MISQSSPAQLAIGNTPLNGATVSDPSSEDVIRYECRDRIATITFNRPEKLNAFNDAMVMRLANVLHQFDIDENATWRSFAARAAPSRAGLTCTSASFAATTR